MAVEIQNPSDTQGATRVAEVGPIPTDPCSNASYALGYSTDGNLTTVEVTRHGVTWTRTLTWTGTQLTAVGTWSVKP